MSTTETTEAVEPEAETRQMRFDGITVRDHSIAITGLLAMDAETVASMKAGKTIKFDGVAKVVARTHRYAQDKDTGDRYVKHQVTLQVDYLEPK